MARAATKSELERRGSWRAKTKKDGERVTGTPGKPRAPSWLNEDGKKIFRQVVAELNDIGVVCLQDQTSLAIYSDTYYEYRIMRQYLDENGLLDDTGKLRSECRHVNTLAKELTAMARSLGLNPKSREMI